MDSSPIRHENPNPSHLPSPNSHSTNSSSSSNSSHSTSGLHFHQLHPPPQPRTPTPQQPPSPLTPVSRSITRSDAANPFPTTFVQADTSSFKQVVQMLTGSSETVKHASDPPSPPQSSKTHIPPIKSLPKKQHSGSGFKLYERRNSLKNLKINTLNSFILPNNSAFSPRNHEILSPSILDFPSLVLSPVTPLIRDPFDRSSNRKTSNSNLDREAEEKAIKDKGFFLHPSPATTPRDPEPRLLPLFPVTSPRIPGSSSGAN